MLIKIIKPPTRRALIIGSPAEDIQGVKIDVENYKKFLLSPLGGSWHPNELVILDNPKSTVLYEEIYKLKNVDYSMTIFTGHGGQLTPTNGKIIIQINEDETSSDTVLRKGAPKHTLILDCCRTVWDEVLEESTTAMMSSYIGAKVLSSVPREAYDKKIVEAPEGLVVMYGCNKTESSEDSAIGGYYSSSLMQSAYEWKQNNTIDLSESSYQVLSVADAHELAKPEVKRLSAGQQNPTIEKPSSPPYFPFAINAR